MPPQAEGFAVVSPNVELVDLGTEFGMDVSEDGSAAVHVFNGMVELYESGSNRAPETRLEFRESEGASISASGDIVPSETKSVDYVSSTELVQLSKERNNAKLQQWRADQIRCWKIRELPCTVRSTESHHPADVKRQ